MFRYIYLLCFIYFELVFSINSIQGKEHRRLRRRPDFGVHKVHQGHGGHKTTPSSNYDSLDIINFMQKPEAEVFDLYNYEKHQSSSVDDLPLEVPSPRQRRSRNDLPFDDSKPRSPLRQRLHSRHLVHHPKRKCSFAMFPFFSHKNKTKPRPPASPGSKHDKRKSHSFHFTKPKDHYNPPIAPDKREEKIKPDLHITEPKNEMTTMKDLNANCKLKNSPKVIHNSRLYFANPYRINEEGGYGN